MEHYWPDGLRGLFRLTNLGMAVALALIGGAVIGVGDFLLGVFDVLTAEGVVYVVLVVLFGGLVLSLLHMNVALGDLAELEDYTRKYHVDEDNCRCKCCKHDPTWWKHA